MSVEALCVHAHLYNTCFPPAAGRIPQFGYKDEINMDQLVELRALLKARLSEKGVAFSYMPVLIKAVSLALAHHPVLNSTVDPDCTAVTYRADHNVGVAMDTPQGLIVPNIKRVQVRPILVTLLLVYVSVGVLCVLWIRVCCVCVLWCVCLVLYVHCTCSCTGIYTNSFQYANMATCIFKLCIFPKCWLVLNVC